MSRVVDRERLRSDEDGLDVELELAMKAELRKRRVDAKQASGAYYDLYAP